jgi:molybdopterin-guanine dinucleotide biosynthesis protein B
MKVFGFAGWSGSGKTTLVEHLIPVFVARGLRVSVVKHAHHDFDIDKPGKDSHRFRVAGSAEVLVASGTRWALMHEHRGADEPPLAALLAHLSDVDLVLVEGFKRDAIPKLEVHRAANGKSWLHPEDPWVVGIATDAAPDAAPGSGLPRFDLDDVEAIATFVAGKAGGGPAAPVT